MYIYVYSKDPVPVTSQNVSPYTVSRLIVKISSCLPESMHARECRHLSQRQEYILVQKNRGDVINAYKYLKGRCQEDAAKLFSMVPSDRRNSNGNKLNHRKFHLNMKQNFFTWRVAKHWRRLPREVVECLSLLQVSPATGDTVLAGAWTG